MAKRKTGAAAKRRNKSPARRASKPPARRQYWSADVMRKSNALDIERSTFTWRDPKRIARSLKLSAERSRRRKAGPYQSAMSMLNFYINRAGRSLTAERKRVLAQAKLELRRLFDRA
ncbi:MAG TPA: DUF3175 domain-containing protein [Alphaproteobacteria bacterium]|nr:DUF3175 domain-containing protein [Alphaproteobacteria bacterium]